MILALLADDCYTFAVFYDALESVFFLLLQATVFLRRRELVHILIQSIALLFLRLLLLVMECALLSRAKFTAGLKVRG